jgi:hypothetical protein
MTGWQMFLWWRRGWNGSAEVAETTAKRLLCCGFRRTAKAMRQLYQCWWRICREINVFSTFWTSHVLRFISICDLCTDSPLYTDFINGRYFIFCSLSLRYRDVVASDPAVRPSVRNKNKYMTTKSQWSV